MEVCDPYATFWGNMGIVFAAAFSNLGAAYGSAKAGLGMSSAGVMHPGLIMRGIIPIIMAGILGIYGMIVGILISQGMNNLGDYSYYAGYGHLTSGMVCGLSAVVSGWAIGVAGEAGIIGYTRQPKLFVTLVLVMIFAEAIALFGVIVAVVLAVTAQGGGTLCTNNGI
eukprot:Trichotokara_eunicae@DN5000_c0_g1_i1.p2